MSHAARSATHPWPDGPPAGVWHANELIRDAVPGIPTGDAGLDAALPGGGWPRGALTELLLPAGQWPEWRLWLPALRTVAQIGQIVLVGAPAVPNLQALTALGLPPQTLCRIEAPTPQARGWASEQALRCPQVAAVLLWLPAGPPEPLRRLHLAAQAHLGGPLLFVCRPQACAAVASPAPLRLEVQSQGARGLSVSVLKRRGPPLLAPVQLPAPLPRLALLQTNTQTTSARVVQFPRSVARRALDCAATAQLG